MLSKEVSLDLVKNSSEAAIGVRQDRELPGSIGTPEENALGKVFMTDVVYTNGHEVVILNT
jgi:hypothetical protein